VREGPERVSGCRHGRVGARGTRVGGKAAAVSEGRGSGTCPQRRVFGCDAVAYLLPLAAGLRPAIGVLAFLADVAHGAHDDEARSALDRSRGLKGSTSLNENPGLELRRKFFSGGEKPGRRRVSRHFPPRLIRHTRLRRETART
jgi:hypothetical protein